jgi:hypothetical protein
MAVLKLPVSRLGANGRVEVRYVGFRSENAEAASEMTERFKERAPRMRRIKRWLAD